MVGDVDELRGVFAAYLHQDWDLDWADPRDALRDFAETSATSVVERFLAQLDQVLAGPLSDDDLVALVTHDLGSSYVPLPPSETRAWLVSARQVVAEAVATRTD